MADIGVLSLQIHSESTQAENSLRRLEGALLAIKTAVNGSGLNKTVNSLKRLKDAVDINMITNLNGLAVAMKKIQDACNFTVPNMRGLTKVNDALASAKASSTAVTKNIQETAAACGEGFAKAEPAISTAINRVGTLNAGLEKTKEAISGADYSKVNIAEYVGDTVSSLKGHFENAEAASNRFKGSLEASISAFREYRDAALSVTSRRDLAMFGKKTGDELLAAAKAESARVNEITSSAESANTSMENLIRGATYLEAEWEKSVATVRELAGLIKKAGDTGQPNSFKNELWKQYTEANDRVRNLRAQLEEVDRQAVSTAQRLGVEYKSVTSNIDEYTASVNKCIQAEHLMVTNQVHADAQSRRLEYFRKNMANMSDKEMTRFMELFGSDPEIMNGIAKIREMENSVQGVKEGFDSAASSVDSLNKSISETGTAASGKIIDTENINEGLTMLDLLKQKLDIMHDEFGNKLLKGKLDEKGINRYQINMMKLEEQIERLQMKYDSLKEDSGLVVKSDEALKIAEGFMQANSQVEITKHRIEELKIALGAGIKTGTMDTKQMIAAANEIKRLQKSLDGAKESTQNLTTAWSNLKTGMGRLFSPLTKIGKQFLNIAKRMAIRALIRQFTQGLREGIENVYNYSKAIGTSFAPSMDQAATALQQMKNSLGAAVAPALQALIPVLQTVVNWVITGLNYLNQFFALLNGQQTWTRALPATTTAFGKQEKAAKGAAAAVKDLLADWDELNIIQSETSGSGNGTSNNAEDYLNMFEEVGEFDNKIKGIFEFINDNLDKIKRIAKLVGAAFLGWKFSSAFTGVLGTLSGLATLGLTAAVVFEVSTLFTNKYLETGDTGYLVADLLTTLVGSMFAKKILQTVLGGAAGSIAIPLIFTVSAIASIIANMGHTDVSALDEKSINTSLTSALEGGVAAGYLTHLVGASVGKSLLGGVAGAIATFGVSVGLKADAQVAAEGITPENIEAKLISVGALGISGAMVGALAGGGGAGAVGMAMLFGGAPIATFGVAIGINAINEVVDGSAITADVVKNNLLAGGLVGAGLAISTFAVAGATVAGLVAIEAGALTIAALFLIEAIIAKQPAKVKWGNYNATKEEIETFVTNDLMKNPPKVTISLIKATIEPLGSMKTALETNTQNMLGTLYVLQLGLVSDAKESIETEVDTLISSFNEASGQYQKTLEVALSLVPVKNEDGTDTSKEIISNSSSRWSELNGIMTQLGTELADAYKVAYDARLDGNIDETAEKTIEKISNMMTRVANAISSGQARAKASHAIQMQLQNLSKATFDGLIEEYQKQKDELIEELTKVRSESAEGILAQQYAYEELAQYALEDAHGDVTDATYLHYKEMAEQAKKDYLAALANMKKEVEEAADNMVDDDTYQKLREAALGFLGREVTFTDRPMDLDIMDEDSAELKKLWEGLLTGDTAKANVMSKMLNVIKGAFSGEDKDTVADAIKAGILQYSDFLNVDIMDAVAASLGITGKYKDIWDKYVYELLGLNPDGTTPVIEVTPKIQVEDPDISGADISIAPEIANLVNEAKGFTTEDEWEGLYYRMLEKDNIDIDFDYIESAIKGALDEYINANGGSYSNFFGFDFAGIAQSLVDAGYDLDTVLLALEDVLAFAHYNQNWQQPGYGTWLDTWEDRENQDFYKINPNFQGTLVNYAGVNGHVVEGTTEADMAKATEDGTNAANGDHWTTVENLLRQMVVKNWVITLNPTSGWGLFNRNANEAAAAVTGDVP